MHWSIRRTLAVTAAGALCLAGSVSAVAAAAAPARPAAGTTATPIQHVVVIFQENVSFDHYFGTYPQAANSDGQPFVAAHHTPAVDGLPTTNPTSGQCGSESSASQPLGGEQGRCGFGPRLPLLVISPWAKRNAVDN